MSYFEVNSACGGLIGRFVTEGEALICADQHANSIVEEVEGTMPEKFTIEDARRVMNELKEDTPENRQRQELFKEWADNNPGWQSLKEKFGK